MKFFWWHRSLDSSQCLPIPTKRGIDWGFVVFMACGVVTIAFLVMTFWEMLS